MQTLTVRRFEPGEWQTYRELRLRSLRDSPDAFSSTLGDALLRTDADWETRLAEMCRLDLPLIAEVASIPAGLAWGRLEPTEPQTAAVYQMWVAPEFRGRGIAGMLLREIVDWAAGAGSRRVLLGVTSGNEDALRLYRSAGFRAIGVEQPPRPGSRLVVQNMELDLRGRTG